MGPKLKPVAFPKEAFDPSPGPHTGGLIKRDKSSNQEALDLKEEVKRLAAKAEWLDEKLDRLWDVVMEMKR